MLANRMPIYKHHRFWLILGFSSSFLSHVRESKTDLDSGLHVVDSGFQALNSNSLSVVIGFRIPKPIIPDSTSKHFPYSGFRKQKFSRFRIPDSLTWDDLSFIVEIATFCTTILLTPAAITVYIHSVFHFPRFWLLPLLNRAVFSIA